MWTEKVWKGRIRQRVNTWQPSQKLSSHRSSQELLDPAAHPPLLTYQLQLVLRPTPLHPSVSPISSSVASAPSAAHPPAHSPNSGSIAPAGLGQGHKAGRGAARELGALAGEDGVAEERLGHAG